MPVQHGSCRLPCCPGPAPLSAGLRAALAAGKQQQGPGRSGPVKDAQGRQWSGGEERGGGEAMLSCAPSASSLCTLLWRRKHPPQPTAPGNSLTAVSAQPTLTPPSQMLGYPSDQTAYPTMYPSLTCYEHVPPRFTQSPCRVWCARLACPQDTPHGASRMVPHVVPRGKAKGEGA